MAHIPTGRLQPTRLQPTRALHLVDIENLVRGQVTFARVQAAWDEYQTATLLTPADHVIVGFCPETAAIGAFALPAHVRKAIGRRGKDSADHALTDPLDLDFVITHYTEVYIASADSHFTTLATQLTRSGIPVHNILGAARGISHTLINECASSRQLPCRFDHVA